MISKPLLKLPFLDKYLFLVEINTFKYLVFASHVCEAMKLAFNDFDKFNREQE